jgi:hypothetical protein
MSQRSWSVGELAVHFGLEPIDVECLVYSYATGMAWPELMQGIQSWTALTPKRSVWQSRFANHWRPTT